MEPEQKHSSSRRYAVFLSYRHADNKEAGRQWATWLHHLLEGYEIPADLVGKNNSKGNLIPASLYPVFRDEEELPADADLTRNIRQALENSELLVVLCSPRAVESRFVADEIRYFKELGKANRILALMIDGEPNAADDPGKAKLGIKPEAECLPEPLRYGVAGDGGTIDWSRRTEPIAADVRPDGNPEQGWTTGAAYREALQKEGKHAETEIAQKVHRYEQRLELAKLKVVAGSLGVPLGELTRRDKAMQLDKARKRARALTRWLAAVAVLAMLAAAGGIYARIQRREAIAQRQVAESQRKEALKTASTTDFSVADFKMKQGDPAGALPYLADALRQNPMNQAATALAVSILQTDPLLPINLQHDAPVDSASFSADGRQVLTTSGNAAQVWDSRNGKTLGSPIRTGSPIDRAAFTSDANGIIAIEERNGEISAAQLWDSRTGQPAGPKTGAGDRLPWQALSSDGQRLLTVSPRGAQVWNMHTEKPVGPPIWDGVPANRSLSHYAGAFSQDGKRVLVLYDNTVQAWEVDTGKALGKPMQMGDQVSSAQFSADGKRVLIVFGNDSEVVEFWDVDAGQRIGTDISYVDLIHAAKFSPSGKEVVTVFGGQYERGSVSEKVTAQVWDVATGNAVGNPLQHGGPINWVEFSPDGRRILTASDDKTARLWDARTGEQVGFAMQHANKVKSARFSPDGKWIVTASADHTARLWPVQTGRPVGEILRYDAVRTVSFSPDGKRIVSGGSDNKARIWETQTGRLLAQAAAYAHQVDFSVFSPDGARVVSISAAAAAPTVLASAADAHLWDAQTGQPIGEPMHHADSITSVRFSPDGSRVLTSSRDGTAQLWDAATGRPAAPPLKCALWVYWAEFSSDGYRVLTASGDGIIRIWDAQTSKLAAKEIPFVHYPDWPTQTRFSPDGQRVVAASDFQIARMWDAGSGSPRNGPIPSGNLIGLAAFTPDGKGLMTVSGSVVQIWDVQTGRPLTEPMRHETLVSSAEISRDGKWIMTAARGGTARIWDALTGKEVVHPMGSRGGQLYNWAFSPDARWVAAASLDGRKAFVWHAATIAAEAPPWLADLAEAVSGLQLTPQGTLEPSRRDPEDMRQTLRKLVGDDDLSRLGRWFVADSAGRGISPLSPVTVPEFVSQRLKENSPVSVEEAYDADPVNPLVLSALAQLRFKGDKDEARLYFQVALRYARLAGAPEPITQVQAMAKRLFPDAAEFDRATPAPSSQP